MSIFGVILYTIMGITLAFGLSRMLFPKEYAMKSDQLFYTLLGTFVFILNLYLYGKPQ